MEKKFSINSTISLVLLLSFYQLAIGQKINDETGLKIFLRYRLFRVRETALKIENEQVLIEAVKASQTLGTNWNAFPDSEKDRFLTKLEHELNLPAVSAFPENFPVSEITAAIPRRDYLNIPYTTTEGVNSKYVSLDIYTPKVAGKYPVVIWSHGGAMKGGDKRHPGIIAIKPDYFINHGYIFISLNYRLAPMYKFPAQAFDTAAALAFLHDHVDEYGGDPQNLFLIGNSAGGQLAAVVATNESYLHNYGKTPAVIRGTVILDIGSFDIPSIFDQLGEKTPEMYRYTFGEDRQNWIAGSPIYHVKKGKSIPPFLLIFVSGRKHHEQENNRFADKLIENGYLAAVYEARGKTHNSLAKDIGMYRDEPTEEIMKFFKSQNFSR